MKPAIRSSFSFSMKSNNMIDSLQLRFAINTPDLQMCLLTFIIFKSRAGLNRPYLLINGEPLGVSGLKETVLGAGC